MKTIVAPIILLFAFNSFAQKQNLLKEFPDYSIVIEIKGNFNSDSLMDYFYILDSAEEKRNSSKCVLVLSNQTNNKQEKFVFNDLLPSIRMSGKIEEPFETLQINNDTLFVCFVNSEYGHNEFKKESYSFKFNQGKKHFSLVNFKYEVCILPDCEKVASITLCDDELVKSKFPFSYENWLISGGCFSSLNCLVSNTKMKDWQRFATELKQIGLEDQAKNIEDRLLKKD
jgi:hypothetical protein